jgi:hypothetical protein
VHDRLDEACLQYENVIALLPGHIRALKALAYLYLHNKRKANARKIIKKCALFDPSDKDIIELLNENKLDDIPEPEDSSPIDADELPPEEEETDELLLVEEETETAPLEENSASGSDDHVDEVPALELGPDDLDIAYDTGLLQWDLSEEDISHIIITESEGFFGEGTDILPEDSDSRTISINIQDDDNSDLMARKDLKNIIVSAFKADENIRVVDPGSEDIVLTGTLKSIAVTPLLVQTAGRKVADPKISVTVHFKCFETETEKVIIDEELTESCKIDLKAGLSERNKAIRRALEVIKDGVIDRVIE